MPFSRNLGSKADVGRVSDHYLTRVVKRIGSKIHHGSGRNDDAGTYVSW